MNEFDKIYEMSDEQLKAVWESFGKMIWNCDTIFKDDITMDDYAQCVYSEMGIRGISAL